MSSSWRRMLTLFHTFNVLDTGKKLCCSIGCCVCVCVCVPGSNGTIRVLAPCLTWGARRFSSWRDRGRGYIERQRIAYLLRCEDSHNKVQNASKQNDINPDVDFMTATFEWASYVIKVWIIVEKQVNQLQTWAVARSTHIGKEDVLTQLDWLCLLMCSFHLCF